jgi:hypothetical protein
VITLCGWGDESRVRTRSRAHQDPPPAARRVLRATSLILGLAVAATLGGCPGAAELENPERFMQYDAGIAGVGGAIGGAGMGGAGMAQGGMAGSLATGGVGTAGGAGMGSAGWTWNCSEVPLAGGTTSALYKNCVNACHNTGTKYAGLDLSDPAAIRAQMVDKPATFEDFGCQVPPEPYRECTREEMLALGCPPDVKLIDSANFEASWVVKKLNGEHGGCGDAMPLSPGNSVSSGWDAAGRRKQCYLDFFRSLAAPQ